MADMLQMTDVKQSCVNFMLAHLDVDNCIGTTASNHNSTICQLVMFSSIKFELHCGINNSCQHYIQHVKLRYL